MLVVRKDGSWLLPGGKPETGESDLECLCREVHEELSKTKLKNIRYYGEFIGKTHVGEEFKTKVYLADIDGKLGKPSGEIIASVWINDINNYIFSNMNSMVIGSLINENYLKT